MTQLLDIIMTPREQMDLQQRQHDDFRIKGEPKNKDADEGDAAFCAEVRSKDENAPLLDGSQSQIDGAGVAALAVLIFLGVSLLAMSKITKHSR